jgi:hypothetical protein
MKKSEQGVDSSDLMNNERYISEYHACGSFLGHR